MCIFKDGGRRREERLQGSSSSIELEWVVDSGDCISKISGSFTQQSYLNELILMSRNGKSGIFGIASTDAFALKIGSDERVSGCYGSVRELGMDRRITELGFWVEKGG